MTDALQVSCVQTHWAKPLEFNLQRTLHYIKTAAECGSRVVLAAVVAGALGLYVDLKPMPAMRIALTWAGFVLALASACWSVFSFRTHEAGETPGT